VKGGNNYDDDDDDDDRFNKCHHSATELSVRTATLLQLKKLQTVGHKKCQHHAVQKRQQLATTNS